MEWAALAIILASAWLWHDSLGVREAAVYAAREACEDEGYLFLDDTVGISRLTLARDRAGRLKLQRAYAFEYSDTGNNRLPGGVIMLGREVVLLNVGARPTLH